MQIVAGHIEIDPSLEDAFALDARPGQSREHLPSRPAPSTIHWFFDKAPPSDPRSTNYTISWKHTRCIGWTCTFGVCVPDKVVTLIRECYLRPGGAAPGIAVDNKDCELRLGIQPFRRVGTINRISFGRRVPKGMKQWRKFHSLEQTLRAFVWSMVSGQIADWLQGTSYTVLFVIGWFQSQKWLLQARWFVNNYFITTFCFCSVPVGLGFGCFLPLTKSMPEKRRHSTQ